MPAEAIPDWARSSIPDWAKSAAPSSVPAWAKSVSPADMPDWAKANKTPEEETTAAGSFARGAVKSLLPTAAGVASFVPGFEAGAALGGLTGPAAPIVSPVLGLAGGLATSFGGGYAASYAQDKLANLIPEPIKAKMGFGRKKEAADVAQHPYAKLAGEIAPQALFLRPGAMKAMPAAIGGAIGGGGETVREMMGHEKLDPVRIGASAASGAFLQKPTVLGRALGIGGAIPEPPAEKPVVKPVSKAATVADDLNKLVRPAMRGEEAQKMSGIIRENTAQLARDSEVAFTRLQKYGKTIDKMPVQDQYSMIDNIERGAKQPSPEHQAVADEMSALLKERRVAVQNLGVGALEHFIENFFPHIWKEPEKASAAFAAMDEEARKQFSKRSLTGPGNFLKQRTVPLTSDGLAMGLEPVTPNPIDLSLLKIREMDRFIMGTRVMQEMKSTGLSKFVKFGETPPEGWKPIDDKAARALQWSEAEKGFILRGQYYAPDQAAMLINNYLKPGLVGNSIYDSVRYGGNVLNMMQLGFSAFHAGFTTMDAMVSKTALGIKQLSRGDIAKGSANVAKGMLVSEAVSNVWRGQKLYNAYMNPGTGGPMMEKIVDGFVAAGGRVKLDQFYAATRSGSYWNSIENRRFLHELTRQGVARGAAEFFPRLVQTISAPIMEWLVPRQKLGVFSDMAAYELENNPSMSPEEMRTVLGKSWDSVDNRLGEMVYDNLGWNKVIKDLAMISMRSVGWNLGTIREIGGGAFVDTPKQVASALEGKGFNVSDRMAYVAAMPIVTGLYGAIANYLFTGEWPKEIKDYFFPKTGRTTKQGNDERLSLPTYMKDVVEYYHAPGQTVVNKMNPLTSTIVQMYQNTDFYGAQIRDLDAEPLKQSQQEIMYLARQMEPFSVRGQQRMKEEGTPPLQAALAYIGLNPAPGYITQPPEQQHAMEQLRDRKAIRKRIRTEQQTETGN